MRQVQISWIWELFFNLAESEFDIWNSHGNSLKFKVKIWRELLRNRRLVNFVMYFAQVYFSSDCRKRVVVSVVVDNILYTLHVANPLPLIGNRKSICLANPFKNNRVSVRVMVKNINKIFTNLRKISSKRHSLENYDIKR